MDSRKPPTAADELREKLRYTGPLRVSRDLAERLLPLLTPPTDAAVHEARNIIAAIECDIHGKRNGEICKVSVESLRTLLRAVQSPRLTGEQVEAAFREGYELGNDDGRNIDVFCHIKQHNPESNPDFAWEHSNTRRAAFPEAFAGDVGK